MRQSTRRFLVSLVVLLPALAASGGRQADAQAGSPLAIKAVIVATFEVGQDTGDAPGELQYWVEREHLERELPFAGGRSLRLSADGSVLAIVSGTSPTDAAATITALTLDPRFDLTHAYWIVNGIAGVDPENASIGSVAWAHFVVDGDQLYELDSREAPPGWPYGRFALGTKAPNQPPADTARLVYELNTGLVDWAFGLTKSLKLSDTAAMATHRAGYRGFANALKPPFVLVGDDLGSGTFWHGVVMNRWANEWVKLLTGGRGDFVMTDMEDQGIAAALRRGAAMGRVSFQRVLFLRAASNYAVQRLGDTAVNSLTGEVPAATPAFDAAYRTGSVVLHALLEGWDRWHDRIPPS